MILIQSEYYLSAAVTKRCTQQDVRKIVRNSLRNPPSRVRHSEKNCQAAKQESYLREVELESKGSIEDWRFK